MPQDLLWELRVHGEKKQIVGQAEILLVLFVRRIWKRTMEGRCVFYFIDNDAARYSFITGASSEPTSMAMLSAFWDVDAHSTGSPVVATLPMTPAGGSNLWICVLKFRRLSELTGWMYLMSGRGGWCPTCGKDKRLFTSSLKSVVPNMQHVHMFWPPL